MVKVLATIFLNTMIMVNFLLFIGTHLPTGWNVLIALSYIVGIMAVYVLANPKGKVQSTRC